MKFPIIIYFLFTFSSFSAFSQSERIARFNAEASSDNKSILVTWTMSAGSTCPSLSVEKSLDGVNYTEIYVYPSVCGSSDEAISYSWIDASPSNYAKSFYRLNLDDIEYTVPIELDLQSILFNRDMIISPNPSIGVFKVEIRNSEDLKFDVEVFNSSGNLVFRKENNSGKSVLVDLNGQVSNSYFLKVTFSNKETIVSTFIVKGD